MSELIKALVEVKTPLALFAFLSLIALLAFRTAKVPELFFGLMKEKLTREKFSHLLHRFMLFAFISFIVLCSMSVLGQVLSYKLRVQPTSYDDLKTEIQNLRLSEDQKQKGQAALLAYQEGLAKLERDDIKGAIQSIENSLAQIPTLSAEYTLAYLYQKNGDSQSAKEHADKAYSLAKSRNSAMDVAKVEALQQSVERPALQSPQSVQHVQSVQNCSRELVGPTQALPESKNTCYEAALLSPGFYLWGQHSSGEGRRYFKIDVKQGQKLLIDFRTPDLDAPLTGAEVVVYDRSCVPIPNAVAGAKGRSQPGTLEWVAPDNGPHYLSLESRWEGPVFNVCIP